MLTGLRHRAVNRRDHEDRAVHLRRAGDHVLDVVGVTRAVDVGIVPVRRRVLDVAGRDREDLGRVAAALRLGRLGDFVVRDELRPALVRGHLGQRGGQSGLAVVDVADGANVDVRFGSVEFLFSHVVCPPSRCVSALPVTRRRTLPCPPYSSLSRLRRLPAFACRLALRSSGLPSRSSRPSSRERRLEPMTRIELVTSSLPRTRSAN